MNVEQRRCPGCLASLSNEKISQLEIARHGLGEAVDIERANLWNRHVRRAVTAGAIVPIALIITLHPTLVLAGSLAGAGTGWLVAWRHWGHNRACLVYCLAMALPTLAIAGFNPFTILLVICIGTLIGLAIDGAMGT